MTQRAPIYTRIGPREHPRSLLTWTNGVQQGLQPTPFIPRQWDWPNPVRAKISNDLRTWINDIPQEALSLTIPAGQKQRDWPLPLPLRQNKALLGFTVAPQITTAVVASLPFNQSNWPNPQARAQSYDPRTWIEGIPQASLSLTIPDGQRQRDWPNPLAGAQNVTLRTWVNSQQIPEAVLAQPFAQTDWPNPAQRAANADLRFWSVGVQQGLQPVPFIPRQSEWPNPAPLPPNLALRTFAQPDLVLSLALVAVPNVVAETQAQAVIDIQAAGLVEIVTSAYDAVVPVGIVVSQAPIAGSLALPGDSVTIVVSLGVAPVPPVDATVTGGVFWLHYELDQARRRKRRRELQAAEEAAEAIVEPVTQEIAQILQAQERKDDQRAELERLRELVARFPLETGSPRLQAAVDRVRERQTFSSLVALDRELRRMMDEEDAALVMLLLGD